MFAGVLKLCVCSCNAHKIWNRTTLYGNVQQFPYFVTFAFFAIVGTVYTYSSEVCMTPSDVENKAHTESLS